MSGIASVGVLRVVSQLLLSGAVFGFNATAFPQSVPVKHASPPVSAAVPLAPDTGRVPAERRYMPSMINEPLMSMTIQVVKEAPADCVYRSRHFEFKVPVKLGTTAMKEVCRAFESTYELVSKLPWGINPWPEDGEIFRAQLFSTRAQYLASGAPEWSAAVYSMKEKVFKIPFEEVGVVSRGDSYYLGGVINNDTITHEVTHQMMHEYLRFMPIWMAEGLAEYTASLPYNSGRYNVTGALDAFKQKRRTPSKEKRPGMLTRGAQNRRWVSAATLWGYTTSMTTRRFIENLAFDPPTAPTDLVGHAPPLSQLPNDEILGLPDRYYSSHVLVFFFMHFDGDGKATRLKKDFDAIHEERKLWAAHWSDPAVIGFEAAAKKYKEEVEEFKKQPGVIDLGGGRIQYPSTLTAPRAPVSPAGPGNIDPSKVCAKHLGILLGGRTLDALDAEVRAAFVKANSPL